MSAFNELMKMIQQTEAECNTFSEVIKTYPKNSMGMVVEESKDEIFFKAKMDYANAFSKLRKLNTILTKDFKKEYASYRAAKLQKRLSS